MGLGPAFMRMSWVSSRMRICKSSGVATCTQKPHPQVSDQDARMANGDSRDAR
jgi:hypothetical protein